MKHTGQCYRLIRKMFLLNFKKKKINLFGKAANRVNNSPPTPKKRRKKCFGPPIG